MDSRSSTIALQWLCVNGSGFKNRSCGRIDIHDVSTKRHIGWDEKVDL